MEMPKLHKSHAAHSQISWDFNLVFVLEKVLKAESLLGSCSSCVSKNSSFLCVKGQIMCWTWINQDLGTPLDVLTDTSHELKYFNFPETSLQHTFLLSLLVPPLRFWKSWKLMLTLAEMCFCVFVVVVVVFFKTYQECLFFLRSPHQTCPSRGSGIKFTIKQLFSSNLWTRWQGLLPAQCVTWAATL